jgi:hypothetical protein
MVLPAENLVGGMVTITGQGFGLWHRIGHVCGAEVTRGRPIGRFIDAIGFARAGSQYQAHSGGQQKARDPPTPVG